MDIKSIEERSRNMSAIRSKNTGPEIYLRKLLFSKGYRYSLNSGKIPGRPDIFLRKYNTALFVNGCFWHRHANCKFSYMPKSKVEFWNNKFETNMKRDNLVKEILLNKNIKCLVVWECSIKQMKRNQIVMEEYIDKIERFLHNKDLYMEI